MKMNREYYRMYLDDKNNKVLDKNRDNETLTNREKRRLYRTYRVIENIDKRREFNKNYGEIEKLFL